jgi:3-dehydroquinate dehydratase-2
VIKIGLLNGPNLNRLGIREPEIYGSTKLAQIEQSVSESAQRLDSMVECFQSNHEGALIDKIHNWSDEEFYGMIFNPGGFTHTSVAIRDAISSSSMKIVEVHLSNIHAREDFRSKSLISGVVDSVIAGMGHYGYISALQYLIKNA